MPAPPLNLLIVDDEAAHVEAIRRAFEDAGTNVVIRTAGTVQGFRMCVLDQAPDLALLDLNLPDGRALEVLRHPPEDAPFPVLVMTAFGNQQIVREVMKAGAMDYVVKSPAAFALLPRTVERALREWQLLQKHKQATAALQASEASLQSILGSSADGILAVDGRGRVLKANRRFAEMWRIPQPLLDAGDDQALLRFVAAQLADSVGFLKRVARLYASDRNACETLAFQDGRVFEQRSAPLVIGGRIAGRVWSFSDITRQVALEEQNRQAAKMEAVGRLAGGVAHDFNNHLQIILGCVEMVLQALPPDHPQRADILEIKNAGRRSSDLTRQLLAFSRQQAIAPTALDLNAAISGSLKMLSRLIGENIRLHFTVSKDLWPVFMDPSQVDQILANLAVNARDAIAGTGNISIEAANGTLREDDCRNKTDFVAPGDYVQLTFRDDGHGMRPEILPHIFEPFFTTKGLGQGTGLGLATVYGIVKQNHGAIEVQSEPDKGSLFRLYLPRSDKAVPNAPDSAAEKAPTGDETVLLVEDEPTVLGLARRSLVRQGYTVLPEATADAALKRVVAYPEPIHLLLTDVIMPGMGGKALAERVRELRPDIRVLYMSGYPVDIMEQHGHLAPGVHVLQKPFSVLALAQRVRATLDEPLSRPQA